MSAWTVTGLALIAVAWAWVIGACLHLWWIDRAERRWRDWYAALPEAEKLAGARRLLDAVRSETPECDRLVAETFRARLDKGRQS